MSVKIIIVYEKEKQQNLELCWKKNHSNRELDIYFLNMTLVIDHYEELLRILQFKSITNSTHIVCICK